MGNVRSARRAGNGRDCLDEAEGPTIGHIGRIGERIGSSGGGRVCGPRRRGVGSQPSLQCDAQPGARAAVGLCGLAPFPSCIGGSGLTCEVLGGHGGPRQVGEPWDESPALLPLAVMPPPLWPDRLTANRHPSAAGAVPAACDVDAGHAVHELIHHLCCCRVGRQHGQQCLRRGHALGVGCWCEQPAQ